mgnify:CR=1 FL=1
MLIFKKFFQKLFSLKHEGVYRIIYILGIKIKCKNITKNFLYNEIKNLKSEVFVLRQVLELTVDITKIPQAQGYLRNLQIANIISLDILHKILAQNDIKYWLAGGNVLGYVRHNGFVPWDNDIDINLLREDYLKIPKILDNLTKYGFNYSFGEGDKNNDFIIRLKYKNSPMQIDIFPFDCYYKDIHTKEEIEILYRDIQSCYEKYVHKYRFNINLTVEDKLKYLIELNKKNILKDNQPTKDIIYRGADFYDNMRAIYKFDDIFPLREVKFEGIKTYIPSNPENYLKQSYGDYMKLPKRLFEHTHLNAATEDNEIVSVISELKQIREDIEK